MSHIIWNRPDDDLMPLFDRAVARGMVCLFCGGPLSLPCVCHCYPTTSSVTFLHPACAQELATFLSADVKEVLCATNSHLGIAAAKKIGAPTHPEVE